MFYVTLYSRIKIGSVLYFKIMGFELRTNCMVIKCESYTHAFMVNIIQKLAFNC